MHFSESSKLFASELHIYSFLHVVLWFYQGH